MAMPIFRRLLEFFAPTRLGWANAYRIADDHEADVSRIESEAFEDFGERLPSVDEDDGEPGCSNPDGHEWYYSGTAYGGDDESYHGEGRVYCTHCGADGDA